MKRLALALLVAAIPGVVALAGSDSPPPAFEAAVVRADGGLLPIGTFTGGRWRASWPDDPIGEIEIPITLDAVPRAWWGKLGRVDDWQLWADGKTQPIHLVAPRTLPVLCEPRLELMTDYHAARVPPARVQPYLKAGVAVTPPVTIDALQILDPTSPAWSVVGPALKIVFNRAEDDLAREWTIEGDPHPIPREERTQTPLTVEAMYAGADGPDRIYYVEASRKYDHSNAKNPICVMAFGSFFFRSSPSGLEPIGVDLRVVPCDRRGLVYMLPFGSVRVDNRTFWLTQFSNWDFEQYDVIEIRKTDTHVALSTYGGRC